MDTDDINSISDMESHVRYCDGLNDDGYHKFVGNSTVERGGLARGSVSLGTGFEVSEAQARPCDLPSLPACCLLNWM